MRTVLYDCHRALGAKWLPFAGWEMPLAYTGVVEEHRAVREAAGLFDVSHMGRIDITGPDALAVVQRVMTNDAGRLTPGMAQYALVCQEAGGVLDDIVVSRLARDGFMLCVNASNREQVLRHLEAAAGSTAARVVDRSEALAQVALQGPRAQEVLLRVAEQGVARLKSWHLTTAMIAGRPVLISRTGYTGEDGYELYPEAEQAVRLWTALIEAGRAVGLKPCGLGARDTLRLEMGYALYGHELDDKTTPLEAGLARFCRLDKGDFIGRDALATQQREGLRRRLIGFTMAEDGIPRAGYPILVEGTPLGTTTSGNFSPTLRVGIGLGYLPAEAADMRPGPRIAIEIRGRVAAAVRRDPPFYRRRG